MYKLRNYRIILPEVYSQSNVNIHKVTEENVEQVLLSIA